MPRFALPVTAVSALLLLSGFANAQTPPVYTWDGNPATAGVIDNTLGPWNLTDARWYDGSEYKLWNPAAIAQFGSTTSTIGPEITVNEAISLAGMNFLPFSSLPSTSTAFSFNGTGSLNFTPNATISIATNATNGSSGFIRMRVPIVAENLTLYKPEGTTLGFINFEAISPGLTGTLSLKSATGITGGIYASLNTARILNLSRIVVDAGSVVSMGGGGTLNVPMTIAGTGGSNWGAIRVESSNTNFAGGITLSADARFHTHINVLNATISGPITETAGGSKAFNRTANSPVNTASVLATTYTAANTYTGGTVFGRAFTLTNTGETVATEGGLNILDFTAATAPDNNIFYNGTAPGALSLIGGLATPTGLRMNGAAGETNSQTFSGLSVQQSATFIEVNSGASGTANLNLGAITRTDLSSVAIKGPASGSITGTFGGSGDAFLGPWATYTTADGQSSTWASLSGGVITGFTGTSEYADGLPLSNDPAAHVRVSNLSFSDVTLGAETTISTLSMTDTDSFRNVDLAGNTLRLGVNGGIQVVNGAQSLTVGMPFDGSILTAGGTANTAGQVILTNLSSTSNLMVNSSIQNNGTGTVSLLINGTGRTILTGSNSFTGTVTVNSGVLDIRHSNALGSAGTTLTRVMTGASLNLAGNITVAEGLQINGQGIANDGALRNISGTNTVSGLIRLQGMARISSDSGTLILTGGVTSQISATGLTFSGAGDIDVRSNLLGTTNILTKEGRGTLTLNGTSVATGTTTVNNGTLALNFNAATAPASNILYTGVTVGNLAMGNSSTLKVIGKTDSTSTQAFTTLTLSNAGSYRITAEQNGATSLNLNFTGAFTRSVAGALLNFDLPTSGVISQVGGANNTLVTGTGSVAYATVGLSDWAGYATSATTTRNIVGLSSFNGYTSSTATSLTGNADMTGSTTLSAATAISSLRFNQPLAATISQDSTARILTTGGILVTPNVGANTSTISVATLRAPASAPDLVIIQNNTEGILKITSKISQNASAGTTGLTKAGPGTVLIEGSSAYASGDFTGAIRILDGALQIASGTGTSISNVLFYSTTFTLGSAGSSGKLVLGNGATGVVQYGGLRTEGYGTANALVGGSTAMSTFLTYMAGTYDFRTGMIGGTGTNENNLHLTISIGTTQLGPNNTYTGRTSIQRDTVEVMTLANTGQVSSLGTGSASGASTIELSSQTTGAQNVDSVATLRYIGDSDSTTNRVVTLLNNDVIGDIRTVTGNIENTGTGTVKFTSPFTAAGTNLAPRFLRLGGTNTGANEIVSIGDTVANANAPAVVLEKYGTGTWVLTGSSTYSGGTTISGGTLVTHNDGLAGSATGLGKVDVSAGATLAGIGSIIPSANRNVTLTGGTLSVGDSTLFTPEASTMTITLSGTGTLQFTGNSVLALDIFATPVLTAMGALAANGTSDLLVVSGIVDLGTATTLRIGNPDGLTNFAAGDSWQLFDWSGLSSLQGTFAATDLPTLSSDLFWDLSQIYSSGVISIGLTVVVPEPSRMVLVLAGIAWIGTRRHRRAVVAI